MYMPLNILYPKSVLLSRLALHITTPTLLGSSKHSRLWLWSFYHIKCWYQYQLPPGLGTGFEPSCLIKNLTG